MSAGRKLHLLLALLVTFAFSTQVEAAKPKKKARVTKKTTKGAKAQEKLPPAPQADTRAVSELMGPFKWGMSEAEVLTVLGTKVEERYAEQLKATTDPYRQDKLRKKIVEDKAAIKATLVKFDGQNSGYNVSIIGQEFGHKNDESMLLFREIDATSKTHQDRYFFFYEGKLWKMFIAFDAELFQGKTFVDFAQIMMARYGKAAVGEGETLFIFWRSAGHYLRAIDLTKFYGNFCIAISSETVENAIHARRAERNPQKTSEDPIIKSVTEDPNADSKPSLGDPNADVIDSITGPKKK